MFLISLSSDAMPELGSWLEEPSSLVLRGESTLDPIEESSVLKNSFDNQLSLNVFDYYLLSHNYIL